MRNFKLLTVWLLAGVLLYGCELPKEPDFTTSHSVEGPLLVNKTFQFLGGGGSTEVLIDTTKSEFDSLFTVDSDGFISLSKEEDFDFGDLNDAIPEISTSPTSFSSQVGELELGSFSSGSGNLGEANFQDLTGIPSGTVSQGDPVPAQTVSPAVTIDLNTDFFTSAMFKGGSLEIVLENNLGFNLDNITLTLITDPNTSVSGDESDLVTDNTGSITDGSQATISLPFNNGDELANPQVRVSISWISSLVPGDPNAQTFQRSPVSLVVVSAEGNNLVASQVQAAVEGQDFSTSNTTTFDAAEFQFTDPSHYVELESGSIEIDPIVNDLELAVETLQISFPGIVNPVNGCENTSAGTADSLVVDYAGGIPAASGGNPGVSVAQNIDLAGYCIFAENNEITYNISAVTENTQSTGTPIRTIEETQEISSAVGINNLAIARARGVISSQTVVLGDDDPSNGTDVLDIFNNTEAELTEIDGLEDLSKEIEGLSFTQASLTINYESNIGVPTTIYGAFLGVNGEGEQVYMRGTGTDNSVLATDPISGLEANGQPIPADSLIKFELQPSTGGTQSFSLTFDETNSSVAQFLNNLPSEIRFIGKSIVNEDGGVATISTPLEFDPVISVNLPLALQTTQETVFRDTTETDALQDLPGPDDDATLTEGLLILDYVNGLPLGFSVSISFVDELGNTFLTLPGGGETYDLDAAEINPTTLFAQTPADSQLPIALTEGQLSQLYQTASIIIEANLNTFENSEVKIRSTDSITLGVGVKLSIETVNN